MSNAEIDELKQEKAFYIKEISTLKYEIKKAKAATNEARKSRDIWREKYESLKLEMDEVFSTERAESIENVRLKKDIGHLKFKIQKIKALIT